MPKTPSHNDEPLDVPRTFQRAITAHKEGKLEHAERLYRAILKLQPAYHDALHLMGVLHVRQEKFEEAVRLISLVLGQNPRSADAHFNLGIALGRLNRHIEALASYERALAIKPDYPEALNNRGTALAAMNRHEEAIVSFSAALAINPCHVDALTNRGNALQGLSRHEEAIADYDKALALKPDSSNALYNRGIALQALKRYEDAIANYQKVVVTQPDHADAFYSLGHALLALGRHEEALASFEKTLAIKPNYKYAFGYAADCRAHICAWKNRDLFGKRLVDDVRCGKPVITPFAFLAVWDSPADQLTCATSYIQNKFPPIAPAQGKRPKHGHDRIRVAYLSADFCDHATAYLMAGLVQAHDRKKFEILGISFGRDSESKMRGRLLGGFDRFIDVQAKSDEEVATLLRELEVDIAVDLKGFTKDARTGIFARRSAPVQVNFLGYPGTMGAEYIDYIVADQFVIPREYQNHYAEKIIHLPDSYQVNDSKREISERTPTRAEVGLPKEGFIFCCFNNSYKITPQMFDIWMRLLQRVEYSVFWLYQQNLVTISNLRREARVRDIDPSRLVFAPRIKQEDHLARQRLADLFLDTLPVNAHTTASDALWVGLPVLTCAGNAFSGRVAGSLLHALGLPELVTSALADYEALALKLATNGAMLGKLRERLAQNRLTKALFDTDRFRRHIEAAYMTMWEINQRGEQPQNFAVPPINQSFVSGIS